MKGEASDLRHCDVALPGKLFLGLLAGVGVGQVAVEVLVQNLRRLFAEIPPLASCVEKSRPVTVNSVA